MVATRPRVTLPDSCSGQHTEAATHRGPEQVVRTPEALHFCVGTFSGAADMTSSAKQGPWTSHNSPQEKPFWKEPGEFSLWAESLVPSGFSEGTAFLTHSLFGTQGFSRSFLT